MKYLNKVTFFAMLVIALTGCSISNNQLLNSASADNVSEYHDSHTNNENISAASSSNTDKNKATTSDTDSSKMTWAFTKEDEHPEKLLIQTIGEATSTLDIAIYSLTHPDIVKAIMEAEKRGVKVRIVSDGQQSSGKTQAQALKMLDNAGVQIKIDNHSGLMHEKISLIDQKITTIGSYNYSKAASTTNDEVLMVVRDPKVTQSFEQEFERMWKDDEHYLDYADWLNK